MLWEKLKPWRLPCKYHDSLTREIIEVTDYLISQGLKELDDMSIKYADITPFDSDERINTIVSITRDTSGWEDSELWKERRGVLVSHVNMSKRFILETDIVITYYNLLSEAYTAFEEAHNNIDVHTATLIARDAIMPLATFNKRNGYE